MSPTSPPTQDLLRDPLYPRLKEHVIGSTGLVYYSDKDADLARRIRRRLEGFGFKDCRPYLDLLCDPRRGPSEMDALIGEITIGETYFFRHREHFDALREVVLPELIARNPAKRRLNIWCAGCADGAEPYSLSILLRRELAHLLTGWNVSILGTDINRQSLAFARAGRFEEWSLRATSESIRRSCFEENGKSWAIASEYKTGISFQFHNLVEHSFPTPVGDFSEFDLIVCRNVMIYFGPEQMRRTVQKFHACLAPGGWLLVGPSEPNMTHFTSFHAVNAPGVTLFQRPHQSTSEFTEAFAVPTPPLPVFFTPPDREPAKTIETQPGNKSPTLADLRHHADQGDWENAARCGRELLESDHLNALLHFHYALILEQMGELAESERSLRNAIYLDRQAVQAHYHLGLLRRSSGDWRQAARCFDNAIQLLTSLPGDAILSGMDGITATELKNLAQTQLNSLRQPE